MKKFTFILGLFVVVAFSSCNKEKDCTCQGSMNGENVGTPSSGKIEDGDCSDLNSTTGSGDYIVKINCTEN